MILEMIAFVGGHWWRCCWPFVCHFRFHRVYCLSHEKKDEGSYALDEPKRSPAMNSYAKNATNREFYAWIMQNDVLRI
ncbi:hypothetical protein DOY81_013308 [Sarcophaga bullata]|nr:hypothetical protein DOY81_013308 [Sarcophaga bullata]